MNAPLQPTTGRGASIRAAFAAKRAPLLEKLRALLAEDATLDASALARRMSISRSAVRSYAAEAGLALVTGQSGRPVGIAETRQRASPSPESVRLRAASISATAAKKREAVMVKLRAAFEATPDASNEELAQQVGVSSHSVGRYLENAGLRAPRELGDLSAALDAYRTGMSCAEVCRKFHVGMRRLLAARDAAGIPKHKAGPKSGVPRKPKTERRVRPTIPGLPVDKRRNVGAITGHIRIVRLVDDEMLAATTDPTTAKRLRNFFGAGVELRSVA